MKLAITGASGLVGWPITQHLLAKRHDVTALGRTPLPGAHHLNWRLGDAPPDLSGFDGLVHAAFSHVPGRYRGGEGEDPTGFVEANQIGTERLWEAARAAGVHAVYLSSRAVYGRYPAGTTLTEALPPRPDTLYGEVKRAGEVALGRHGVSLRVTGVFGPAPVGRTHKWADLFARFERGEPIAPRISTEVYAGDVARAVEIALSPDLAGEVLNVSGFVLDRRSLLETYARISGASGQLPAPANAFDVNAMQTDRLTGLGWTPSGPEILPRVIARMIV